MTRDRALLVVYAGLVVAVTAIQQPVFLAAVLLVAGLAAGRDAARLARKALGAIALFNSAVTACYAIVFALRHEFSAAYLVLVNVRVFLLTFLTFLAARRIHLLRALSFSRTLCYLVTLVLGQTATFRRLLLDFRLAFASRTMGRVTLRDLYRHAASSASFLYLKALEDVSLVTEGMRSRGFFDD